MFLQQLEVWKRQTEHKPIVLRGARQVGKTTLVNLFAESFDISAKATVGIGK